MHDATDHGLPAAGPAASCGSPVSSTAVDAVRNDRKRVWCFVLANILFGLAINAWVLIQGATTYVDRRCNEPWTMWYIVFGTTGALINIVAVFWVKHMFDRDQNEHSLMWQVFLEQGRESEAQEEWRRFEEQDQAYSPYCDCLMRLASLFYTGWNIYGVVMSFTGKGCGWRTTGLYDISSGLSILNMVLFVVIQWCWNNRKYVRSCCACCGRPRDIDYSRLSQDDESEHE